MWTETFRGELEGIRDRIHHSFRHRTGNERKRATWRVLATDHEPRSRLAIPDLMQRQPITVRSECLLGDALELIRDHGISGVPVVDDDGLIVGSLYESDLMRIFSEPEATNVASVMTRDPAAIAVDAPLIEVADAMMATGFRRVLVHDSGRLVGIITRRHMLPAILEALEERVRFI